MTWDAANSRWQGAETYALIWADGQHPDNTLDSVRVWTAPSAGTAVIAGNVAKGAAGGDGVVATILHNAMPVFNQTIAAGDMTGYAINETVTVAAGDKLYFRVNRNGTRSFDTTAWNPVITFIPSL